MCEMWEICKHVQLRWVSGEEDDVTAGTDHDDVVEEDDVPGTDNHHIEFDDVTAGADHYDEDVLGENFGNGKRDIGSM